MSNGSAHDMGYIAEVTWGTTPATPAFTNIRNTGTTLGLAKDSLQSEEIRSDRQIADFRSGTYQVNGDINVELSYSSFDDLLQAVLCGTWAPTATITGTTISAASADNSYNDSGNGFVTAGFVVGQRVVVTGFTGDVANNIASGVLTAVTAGKLTVGGTDGDVIVTDAAGESVTISSLEQTVKAGTTRRSFTIERDYSDLAANRYHRFTGTEFNTFNMQVDANKMITASFGVLGKTLALSSSIIAGATYPAATTTTPLDSFTGDLNEGGSAIAVITAISLSLDNGLAPRFVVGEQSTIRPSIGRSNVTGSITAYFEDTTMLNKFINETESSIDFTLPDAAGNSIVFYLPRIKYTGGQPDVTSEGPITLTMPFQALLDDTADTNIYIERVPT